MPSERLTIRALHLGESIDIKGLEREDAFSKTPLGFRTNTGGSVVIFKTGSAAFINLTPIEEDDLIRGLGERIKAPLEAHEIETATIDVKPTEDDGVSTSGAIQIKAADPTRLLLIAEALAMSVALAYDERRVASAFERVEPIATNLIKRQLSGALQPQIYEEIGEALLVQHRLASRADLDDKPDVLWDRPELERFWAKLVDEYDLPARARAVGRKLDVIRESADTITDLVATRTSHRLEWYIIGLITFEIALTLFDKWKSFRG
jgi:uncharacterized Rmd1/YagE family protein